VIVTCQEMDTPINTILTGVTLIVNPYMGCRSGMGVAYSSLNSRKDFHHGYRVTGSLAMWSCDHVVTGSFLGL